MMKIRLDCFYDVSIMLAYITTFIIMNDLIDKNQVIKIFMSYLLTPKYNLFIVAL
jgi:hypothetical protein